MSKNVIPIQTRANKKRDDKKYKEGEEVDHNIKNTITEDKKMASQETLNKILEGVQKSNEGIALLNNKFDNLDRDVNKLKTLTHKNSTEINAIMLKIDNMEQYSRKNNIRIFGLPENINENTPELILNIIKDKLKINNILPDDIEKAFRTGKTMEEKPRAVFIRFKTHQNKIDVYGNKNKLKGTKITIREDLTKLRVKILNEKMEKYGKKNVWTLEGKIKWIDNGTIHTLNLHKQWSNNGSNENGFIGGFEKI